jgi:hypothetical protein
MGHGRMGNSAGAASHVAGVHCRIMRSGIDPFMFGRTTRLHLVILVLLVKGSNTRQLLTLQELETRSTASRNVRHSWA